ncbi:MAG: general secretion pathway protein GspK [Candidatus Electrothrix sp. YB6]
MPRNLCNLSDLHDRSGMALLLTLLAVSFLVALTVRLGTSVNRQMQAAADQGAAVQLDAMLLSGLNLARASLLADQKENDYDAAFDSWGTFDTEMIGRLFPDGKMSITVTDLSGLLQANALVWTKKEKDQWKKTQKKKKKKNKGKKTKDPEKIQQALWKRFLLLENNGIEETGEDKVAIMLDSLADWLDENDEERENGAEKGYYSSLERPYIPTDGPLTLIEELQLVKGWGKKNLYGSEDETGFIDDQSTPRGIISYLTVGRQPGKININTAPALVLQALHEEMTPELAAELVNFRKQEENKELLAETDWYWQVSGFPGDISFDQELVTTESSCFRITVTAEVKGFRRTGTGIIRREETQEQVLLNWKVE